MVNNAGGRPKERRGRETEGEGERGREREGDGEGERESVRNKRGKLCEVPEDKERTLEFHCGPLFVLARL